MKQRISISTKFMGVYMMTTSLIGWKQLKGSLVTSQLPIWLQWSWGNEHLHGRSKSRLCRSEQKIKWGKKKEKERRRWSLLENAFFTGGLCAILVYEIATHPQRRQIGGVCQRVPRFHQLVGRNSPKEYKKYLVAWFFNGLLQPSVNAAGVCGCQRMLPLATLKRSNNGWRLINGVNHQLPLRGAIENSTRIRSGHM